MKKQLKLGDYNCEAVVLCQAVGELQFAGSCFAQLLENYNRMQQHNMLIKKITRVEGIRRCPTVKMRRSRLEDSQ